MPGILKHSSRKTVVQLRVEQPLTQADVVLARSAVDGFPGDSELGAAGDGDNFGDGDPGQDLLEGGFEDVLEGESGVGKVQVCGIFGILDGAHFGGTAEDPGAAEVDVAGGLDVGGLKMPEGNKGVIVWVVVVPGEALGVDKDGGRGEGAVAVDDMSERSLVTFPG